ncbi:hypothetical protein D3C71_1787320 [compost metagenome]
MTPPKAAAINGNSTIMVHIEAGTGGEIIQAVNIEMPIPMEKRKPMLLAWLLRTWLP